MQHTKYGPKASLSPTIGDPCAICRRPLAAGEYTTLVRPTTTGRYSNDATEAHWECAVQRPREAPP